MLSSLVPPSRGFKPEADGKSGNMKLGVNCSYCDFKEKCHPGLRTFMYYKGTVFLTKVERVPDVKDQYESLLQKQGSCCAICRRSRSEFRSNLAVDHDHTTGEIRGLLCIHCNHRLVGRHRDGQLLRRIADYVEQGTGWFVPPKPKKKRRKRSPKSI